MQTFAIKEWPDTEKINKDLQALVRMPMRPIAREHMDAYIRAFETRCAKSRQMTDMTRSLIPGAGQHNIAFNYPFPIAIERASGPYMWDIDGNRYVDFAAAGGPVLLGHNHPEVNRHVAALLQSCSPATGFLHEYEYKLAQLISQHIPSIEMFRMLGSGTEAVMGAIRLARAFTGKSKIIKVGGDFHGWADQMVYSLRLPKTTTMEAVGIPNEVFTHIQETFPNDIACLKEIMAANEECGGTAAVILEPLGPESGTRPVLKEYNRQVRELCDRYQSLLIFDEVVTGFRVGLSGAQGYFGIKPDLTVLGKIIAGGYPAAGGIGGRREIVSCLAAGVDSHSPKAYVGGTLAANPMSCVAGYHAIKEMEKTDAIGLAGKAGDRLTQGLNVLIERYRLPYVAYNFGSICHLQTSAVMQIDITDTNQLLEVGSRKTMMQEMAAAFCIEGVLCIAGSRFYTTAAHTDEVIDDALGCFERVFQKVVPQTENTTDRPVS